ncbi:helix-turn-helix domain-containing protein [Sphingomonas sp. Leaf10]|uniref:helix-turn-helix domain-containing protein n=1 Tax=Sphingomonas sp. Leaf10 TaxID=1735676 RepID=UPI0007124A1A|nr:helix-turn-helix domain-containing protein [Sphingomonas sp. Leaf10]KQM37987.1 hypothetical protein ASE59_11860 [Sphingomonas sp. Leaf10]
MASILLAPQEAAERLLISERTLRDLKRKGLIRYVAVSARRIAYRPDDLDEYVESQVKQEAGPQPTTPPRKQVRRPSDIIPFSKRNG